MGAQALVDDDLSSVRLEHLASVRSSIELVVADLRDRATAESACDGRELIFHLAAAHGGRGYIDTHPVECLDNMALDHSAFTAAGGRHVAKVVFASSACAYPTVLQASTDRGGVSTQ